MRTKKLILDVAVEGRLCDAKHPAHLRHRVRPAFVHGSQSCDLRRFQLEFPAADSAPRSGRCQSGLRPLADQVALELSQRTKELKDQSASAGRGVKSLLKTDKTHALRFQLLDHFDEVFQRPPQPVKPPDNEAVSAADKAQGFGETGPLGLRA